MWIKIILIIFIILFGLYIKRINHIPISNNLNDFDNLINGKIKCIHIKNFYPESMCNIILDRIDKINNSNLKKWRYSKNEYHDVSVFQIPFSDVLNDLVKPEDYFHQKDWKLYEDILNPIDYFISINKHKKIIKSRDKCITDIYPKYKKYTNKFQESIIRIYKPNTYNKKDGLDHIDIDETGYYTKYKIYTMNIYLNIPNEGGELKINNIKIKPNKGDLIIFDPSYIHSVVQPREGNRISIQSFLLYNKENGNINIRI